MNKGKFFALTILLIGIHLAISQEKDPAIEQLINKHSLPKDVQSFQPLFHLPPINQDTTTSCWSFSTLSFIESEMHRMGKKPVRLALMYPVYCAFLEKAKLFAKTQGTSRFGPGDLFSTVINVVKEYGIMPQAVYRGQTRSCLTFNHKALYAELHEYMNKIKQQEFWNEEGILRKVRRILNKHLGEPPEKFQFEGKIYTPKSFEREIVALRWDDYVLVTSFTYTPFNTFAELEVPDNWRKNNQYFNVPLAVFYQSLKTALENGYSAAIDGDFTEPGRYGPADVAVIPAYDVPAEFINQQARQYRFDMKVTTDDHLMHIVGYQKVDNEDWFLVKDSWRDAFQGKYKGYFFYHGDYVKLKVLAYLVHKDGVPDIIKRIQKMMSETEKKMINNQQ